MEIIWSPRATAEFQERVRWLENNSGQSQVTRYLGEVMAALDRITNPLAAYKLVKADPETRCYPVNKLVTLYYRPLKQQEIELVTFFDTRQDPSKLKL